MLNVIEVNFRLKTKLTEKEIKEKIKQQFENATHIFIDEVWIEVEKVYECRRNC